MMQEKFSRNQYLIIFGIAVLAIAIRFLHLGDQTLSESEANLALQALMTAKGQAINWSGQPLYLVLTSFLFTLFDQTNFIARLIPAIFGTLVIAIPFLYRKNIGNWGDNSFWLHFWHWIPPLSLYPGQLAVRQFLCFYWVWRYIF